MNGQTDELPKAREGQECSEEMLLFLVSMT